MHYLGIDIGGTTVKAGIVDETGHVVKQSRITTVTDNWDAFLANLIHLIRGYQEDTAFEAVGIGVPGFRNSYTRQIIAAPNIPCLLNASLERQVADKVHLPVVTENDANAAAYAEFVCGRAVGLQHMAFLTLGTGVGSGLILNGKLFTGSSGYAAEFGHTIIQPEGRPCGCGSNGCIETVASARGIVLTALELMAKDASSRLHAVPDPLTSERIFEAAVAGDSVARATFEQTGRWLGMACFNLINSLNLQMIVLGGGVLAAGDLLMKPLLDFVQHYAISGARDDCRIVPSMLWPDSGIIGAAMLARYGNWLG
jgi:glucokinase